MQHKKQELGRVKQEIVNYLRNNPGCSKADIIRHLKTKRLASRITVLEYIKDLEAMNIIYEKKERPNSQSIMMYINEENKLASILVELEEFKESYFNLLEKSKEKINNRDYSADAKTLGIAETDPVRWSDEDKVRYFELVTAKLLEQLDEWEESEEKINERLLRETRMKMEYPLTEDRLKILADRLFEILKDDKQLELLVNEREVGIERLVESVRNVVQNTIDRKQILLIIKSYMIAFKAAAEDHSKYVQYIIDKVMGEGGVISLTYRIINIFHLFTDIMFFRSTIKWPDIVQDKETLLQMYFAVHSKTIEIQFELSKFIRSINLFPTVAVTGLIVKAKKHYSEFSKLPEMVWSFQALNMGSEIGRVLTSIFNLNKEIKELDFLDVNYVAENLSITLSLERSNKKRDSITSILESVDAVLPVVTSNELTHIQNQQPQLQKPSPMSQGVESPRDQIKETVGEALEEFKQGQQPQQSDKISDSPLQTYYQVVEEELRNSGVEAYTDKWNQLRAVFSKLDDIIQDMTYEDGINKSEAIQLLIKDRKDLLKRAADEINVSESEILRILTDHIDFFIKAPPRVRRVRRVITRRGEERIVEPGSERLTGEEEKEKQRQQEVS